MSNSIARHLPYGLTARHFKFVAEYLTDMNASKAAARAGYRFQAAGGILLKRIDIQQAIHAEMQARSHRLQIDADAVLTALIQQLARLTSMLGQDIAALYAENGTLKPVSDWPAVWRERLVTEIESRDESVRSHDGEDAEGRGGWDTGGIVRKIKRESTLAIERQIRECLRQIGEHVNVAAFQSEKGDFHLHVTVTAERAREVAAAKRRMSKIIDVTPERDEND